MSSFQVVTIFSNVLMVICLTCLMIYLFGLISANLKQSIGKVFEPLVVLYVFFAGGILWLTSSGFRREMKIGFEKTGRSRLVLLRYLTKSLVRSDPLLVPSFVCLPGFLFAGAVLAAAEAVQLPLSYYKVLVYYGLGCAVGFFILVLIPLVLPVPSLYTKSREN
ncbi:hypothetical protein MCAMS1_02872 [biofilm metagenome]